jgi:hypothetical protein
MSPRGGGKWGASVTPTETGALYVKARYTPTGGFVELTERLVTVSPAPAVARRSTLSGAGASFAVFVSRAALVVEPRDKFGNINPDVAAITDVTLVPAGSAAALVPALVATT